MILARLHKPIYERRVRVLADRIVDVLRENDRVLDIGSGSGTLAATLHKTAITQGKPIHIEGIEKHPRGNEAVRTLAFDGYQIPGEDGCYDVTILADVVHHEEDYMRLLQETARVTKRVMIIKDHTSIRLYPEPFNFIFGNRLQYLAFLDVGRAQHLED